MATPSVYLLDGNIASGKTSLARRLLAANPRNTIVLNDDAIWYMLGAGDYRQGFRSVLDSDVRKTLRFLAGIALGRGKDVVIDLPAVTPELRNEFWFGSGQAHHYLITLPWEQPSVHADRRFTSDARGYTYHQWYTVAVTLDAIREPLGTGDQAWHHVTPELIFGLADSTKPTGGSSSPPQDTSYSGSHLEAWRQQLRSDAQHDCPDCFPGEDYP